MPQINVVNFSAETVDVFVSNYNGGSDDWNAVNSETGDNWSRSDGGWELVAFKKADGNRAGAYVKVGSKVHFYDLNNIQVVPPS